MKGNAQIEIIPKFLYFEVKSQPFAQSQNNQVYYFSVDTNPEFQYFPFYNDFGPPSILQIHKFYNLLLALLSTNSNQKIIFYSSNNPKLLSNSIIYIASFRMIYLKLDPKQTYIPFIPLESLTIPYCDASGKKSMYNLSIFSCLKSIYKSINLGWYDPSTFSQEEWEKYDQIKNGDMNWIIPHKILAFATPFNKKEFSNNYIAVTPNDIIPTIKKFGITHIVRLCHIFYDQQIFLESGIKHTELYFMDGSIPPMKIREDFLTICESDDIVGVHCKAGLGRTGTLIACYLIKDFKFAGDEAIDWLRICRPGSITGRQQLYLIEYDKWINSSTQIPKELAPAFLFLGRQKSKQKLIENPTPPCHKKITFLSLQEQNEIQPNKFHSSQSLPLIPKSTITSSAEVQKTSNSHIPTLNSQGILPLPNLTKANISHAYSHMTTVNYQTLSPMPEFDNQSDISPCESTQTPSKGFSLQRNVLLKPTPVFRPRSFSIITQIPIYRYDNKPQITHRRRVSNIK